MNSDNYHYIQALILAPSKELCNQISKNIFELIIKCSRAVKCVDISAQVSIFIIIYGIYLVNNYKFLNNIITKYLDYININFIRKFSID